MNIAEEMRIIAENAGKSAVDSAYATVIDKIKVAAESGKREIVWDPYIKNYTELGFDSRYLCERDKELLKEKLERDGFKIVCPMRISGGVLQTTEYIQW
jgi:hypothetical protein